MKLEKDHFLYRIWQSKRDWHEDLRIYDASIIEERNNTWETALYFPDYLAIGDDGGGRIVYVRKQPNNEEHYFLLDVGCPFMEHAQIFNRLSEIILWEEEDD